MALLFDDPRVLAGLLAQGTPGLQQTMPQVPMQPIRTAVPIPRAPAVSASPPAPSLADRVRSVFHGIGEVLTGPADPRLTPEQNAAARKQALIRAGLTTMLGAGQGMSTLPALAAGALAGQSMNAQIQAQDIQQAQLAQRQAMLRAAFGNGQIGEPQLLRAFAAAVQSGDMESAKSLAEILKSMGGSQAIDTGAYMVQMELLAPDGKTHRYLVDRRNGSKIDMGPIKDPASSARDDIIEQRRFQREETLSRGYVNETKDIEDTYRYVDSALQQSALAQAGDPAARVNLLYAFVKAMDPNTAVREGELRLVQEAAPLWGKAQRWVEDIAAGKSPAIPTQVVDKMVNLMRRRQAAYEETWQQTYDRYRNRAQRWGVDPTTFQAPPRRYRQGTPPRAGIAAPNGDVLSPYLKR